MEKRTGTHTWLLPAVLGLALLLGGCTAGREHAEASASPIPSLPPASRAPVPTATPAPDPDPVEEAVAGMSLRDKLCQMMMVYPSSLVSGTEEQEPGEGLRQALEEWPVGGLLYNSRNLRSQEQVREMTRTVQSCSSIPLLLACDEEGGRVARLMSNVGTTRLGPMLSYRDQGPDTARENARTIARDMVSCGLNFDLAPVADVWSNPDNTVIGDRAYSDDFRQAAQLIPAAVEGFHAGGVGCVLKHFPGHGDTGSDSHTGQACVDKTLEDLRQQELLPFQAGIDAGADAVMLGHLTVPDVDDVPATVSRALAAQLLRQEMGFEGVIMTDALEMGAVTDFYETGELAVRAVDAGVDLLLCPDSLERAVAALEEAVEDGRLSESRLDESVSRLLRLKLERGIWSPA